ncbi:MAG: class I SAM-dependent methyltransferase [Alphaproteobacteria bacterium]
MDRSYLVRLIGFPATLIHGDLLLLDRWLWLRKRLPITRNNERLIDVGCGSGAFTIGSALRGYECVGLSWDERNQKVATERAAICNAKATSFPICDVRRLGECGDFQHGFDVAICFENIEHVLDDRKLMRDIYRCLKPGGHLLLTAPNYFYRAISPGDNGPFEKEEHGWHVRRGYTSTMLRELCDDSGFMVEEFSSCSGFFSQKITALLRLFQRQALLGWAITAPLRIIPLLLDRIIGKLTGWPDYSICLVAFKPRFPIEGEREGQSA